MQNLKRHWTSWTMLQHCYKAFRIIKTWGKASSYPVTQHILRSPGGPDITVHLTTMPLKSLKKFWYRASTITNGISDDAQKSKTSKVMSLPCSSGTCLYSSSCGFCFIRCWNTETRALITGFTCRLLMLRSSTSMSVHPCKSPARLNFSTDKLNITLQSKNNTAKPGTSWGPPVHTVFIGQKIHTEDTKYKVQVYQTLKSISYSSRW